VTGFSNNEDNTIQTESSPASQVKARSAYLAQPSRRGAHAAFELKWLNGVLCALLAVATSAADGPPPDRSRPLADLSIEELMNESVTSVSKKETKPSESPAAITVITSEDIRRIGATTIPEALRIVPGLDVARINASETYGIELLSRWRPTDWWRLTASYTWLHMRLHPDEGNEFDNPQHQFNVRSYIDITRDLEFNAAAYYVDQTLHLNGPIPVTTPSYMRLDLGLTWRPAKSRELSVRGQNLLDDRHSEFISYHASFLTEVPRGVLGKITWRF